MIETQQQRKTRVDLEKVDLRLAVTDETPVGDLPLRISCREHPDPNPSLCVYPDHLHCYSVGCGLHIQKRMEALAYLLSLPSWRDALRVAHKYTHEGMEDYRARAEARARRDPLPRAVAELYHKQVGVVHAVRGDPVYVPMQWFEKRGLTWETVSRFLLGHDGMRFTIPVFGCKGELLNIRFRKDPLYCTEEDYSPDGSLKKRYSGVPGRNGTYLYPEWLVAEDTRDFLVITEGELDAVRLWQENIPAATTTNGAGNLCSILNLLVRYDRMKNISIATDRDEAGDYAAHQLAEQATREGYKVEHIRWPRAWGKDITELYLSGHTLQEALRYTRGLLR